MNDFKLKIEYYPIEKLTPYKNNTRKHEKDDIQAIKNSINEFGMCDPIGIWSDKNIIVEGHGRLLALQELGFTEAPCIRLDHLDDTQRRAYATAHNKIAELSEWDFEKLEAELRELAELNYQMDQFGFDQYDDDFIELVEDEAPLVDEESEPQTKFGDVYRLGKHRLVCGNATDLKDVQKLMNGDCADLVFTDPPYNVDYEGKTIDKLKIENDKKTSRDFYDFLYNSFINLNKVTKEGGVAYVCHAHMESVNFIASFQAAGFYLSQMLVWNKSTLALGRSDYQWKHEPIMYGWKTGGAHYFTDSRLETTVIDDKPNINKMSKGELKEYIKELWSNHPAATVINEDKPSRNAEHPTMKPIKLIAYFLKNSSRKDEIVLDVFGGSGSTLIACEQLNRRCRMIELDPKYCDVIIKRWETLTGKQAELIERVETD